jgi:hydrogenase maturation protease
MHPTSSLVIGYGNRLRSDDSVGVVIAETVESWQIPGVRALAVPQLVPELIEEIKQAGRVLFADAAVNVSDVPFLVQEVQPKPSNRSLGHHGDPGDLLAMCSALAGRCPTAWLLTVPGESFDYGEHISATTQKRMNAALMWIQRWLTQGVNAETLVDLVIAPKRSAG